MVNQSNSHQTNLDPGDYRFVGTHQAWTQRGRTLSIFDLHVCAYVCVYMCVCGGGGVFVCVCGGGGGVFVQVCVCMHVADLSQTGPAMILCLLHLLPRAPVHMLAQHLCAHLRARWPTAACKSTVAVPAIATQLRARRVTSSAATRARSFADQTDPGSKRTQPVKVSVQIRL